jgi:hypothetical protein
MSSGGVGPTALEGGGFVIIPLTRGVVSLRRKTELLLFPAKDGQKGQNGQHGRGKRTDCY